MVAFALGGVSTRVAPLVNPSTSKRTIFVASLEPLAMPVVSTTGSVELQAAQPHWPEPSVWRHWPLVPSAEGRVNSFDVVTDAGPRRPI